MFVTTDKVLKLDVVCHKNHIQDIDLFSIEKLIHSLPIYKTHKCCLSCRVLSQGDQSLQ